VVEEVEVAKTTTIPFAKTSMASKHLRALLPPPAQDETRGAHDRSSVAFDRGI